MNVSKIRQGELTLHVGAQAIEKGLICDPMWRTLYGMMLLGTCLVAAPMPCSAADVWGGSLGVANDYLVRGVTRSDGQAVGQADVHYRSTAGFVGGVFASTARIDGDRSTDAELSGFLGYAWSAGDDWRGKALLAHYAYRGGHRSGSYDYDELSVDAAYRGFLDLNLTYAPNYSRYVPYHGLVRAALASVEVNLQRPLYRALMATGGIGYSHAGGYDAGGYVYWSVGASLELAPVALGLSYVDTSSASRALFYDDAATGRWVGTVLWRF